MRLLAVRPRRHSPCCWPPPRPWPPNARLAPLPKEQATVVHGPYEQGACDTCHERADAANPGPAKATDETCLGCHDEFAGKAPVRLGKGKSHPSGQGDLHRLPQPPQLAEEEAAAVRPPAPRRSGRESVRATGCPRSRSGDPGTVVGLRSRGPAWEGGLVEPVRRPSGTDSMTMRPMRLPWLLLLPALLLAASASAAPLKTEVTKKATRRGHAVAPLPPGPNVKWSHGPYEAGDCSICHERNDRANPGPLTLSINETCYSCHDEFQAIMARKFKHVPAVETCTNCHNPHNSTERKLLGAEMVELCTGCHKGIKDQITNAKVRHDAITTGEKCSNCHNPHAANIEKLLIQLPFDLCVNCHSKDGMVAGDGKPMTNYKAWLADNKVWHEPVKAKDCSACHRTHGGNNFRLLVAPYPVDLLRALREQGLRALLRLPQRQGGLGAGDHHADRLPRRLAQPALRPRAQGARPHLPRLPRGPRLQAGPPHPRGRALRPQGLRAEDQLHPAARRAGRAPRPATTPSRTTTRRSPAPRRSRSARGDVTPALGQADGAGDGGGRGRPARPRAGLLRRRRRAAPNPRLPRLGGGAAELLSHRPPPSVSSSSSGRSRTTPSTRSASWPGCRRSWPASRCGWWRWCRTAGRPRWCGPR